MSYRNLLAGLAAAWVFTALVGCTTAPTAPALKTALEAGRLPPLLPVRRFVANIDFAGGYQLSPDGTALLWSLTVGTDAGLAVRPVAGGGTITFPTGFLPRLGSAYSWLPDSRHVAPPFG